MGNPTNWWVKNAHGHTPQTITLQIDPVMTYYESQMGLTREDSFEMLPGMDAWTQSPESYLYQLRNLWKICHNLIDNYGTQAEHIFFWCDGVLTIDEITSWNGIIPHNFSQDQNKAAEEEPIIPFRHPTKGNILIRTFADAAEAYTLHMMTGSTGMAEGFLEIARKFREKAHLDVRLIGAIERIFNHTLFCYQKIDFIIKFSS